MKGFDQRMWSTKDVLLEECKVVERKGGLNRQCSL